MLASDAVQMQPEESLSMVSVVGINGDTILESMPLPSSTSVEDILLRVHDAQKGLVAGCSKLLHDVNMLSEYATLGDLKSSHVQLTVVFEQLPEEDRKEFINKLLLRKSTALSTFKIFPQSARADESVVRAAIQQDGRALEFCHVRFRAEKEFVLIAAQKDRHALQFASPNLRADVELLLCLAMPCAMLTLSSKKTKSL
jgi:hypothetical protein